MKQGFGISVVPGIAFGKVFVYPKKSEYPETVVESPADERIRFEQACETAKEQLRTLFQTVAIELGEEEAAILEVQLLMLDDLDFIAGVIREIESGCNGANAVIRAGETMAGIFASMDDIYMKERAADIRDVSRRVANILNGDDTLTFPDEKFIVVAEDLSPSETVQLPKERILGLVMQKGSVTGHTAILARTYNIPSIIQGDFVWEDILACAHMAIDGAGGMWYTDPDAETLSYLEEKQKVYKEELAKLEQYRGKPSVTKSGKQILLCANIGSSEETVLALQGDAQGIGLMRSEFLYLGRSDLPDEEELFASYSTVAQTMGEKPVIIRTLDIGADKQVDYLNFLPEENPALGLRGIRFCLAKKELLVTQMRAIYRAAHYGNVYMMFPMITSLWELQEAKEIGKQVYEQLQQEGVPCGSVPIGIMIETPAAAVLAEEFAREVDFFSVGTNDLTQYTLALDRQNPLLTRYYDSHHPSVMMLLQYIAKCAHKAGIWAGICGELAGDASVTNQLIEMGYTELSMVPGKILSIRKQVCESEV